MTVTTVTSLEVDSDAVTSSMALKMTAWTAAIRLSSDTRDPTRRSKKSVQSLEDAVTAKSATKNQVWSQFTYQFTFFSKGILKMTALRNLFKTLWVK